jgi:hypothetical protein
VQITKDQFSFSHDFLDSNDLEDELQRSRVYDLPTKSKLAEILSQTILLFIKLTDIIALLYPPQGNHQQSKSTMSLSFGFTDANQIYETGIWWPPRDCKTTKAPPTWKRCCKSKSPADMSRSLYTGTSCSCITTPLASTFAMTKRSVWLLEVPV